jgi:hypothetical protein
MRLAGRYSGCEALSARFCACRCCGPRAGGLSSGVGAAHAGRQACRGQQAGAGLVGLAALGGLQLGLGRLPGWSRRRGPIPPVRSGSGPVPGRPVRRPAPGSGGASGTAAWEVFLGLPARGEETGPGDGPWPFSTGAPGDRVLMRPGVDAAFDVGHTVTPVAAASQAATRMLRTPWWHRQAMGRSLEVQFGQPCGQAGPWGWPAVRSPALRTLARAHSQGSRTSSTSGRAWPSGAWANQESSSAGRTRSTIKLWGDAPCVRTGRPRALRNAAGGRAFTSQG